MHTIIIGVGGVGAYFGGKIANSGQKITFITRGNNLDILKTKGLRVKSVLEPEFTTTNYQVENNLENIKKPDLILVCTKSWQVSEVAALLKNVIYKNTAIIPLQNGADNVDKLLEYLPEENVLGGLCQLYSKMEAPGVVNHFGNLPKIIFGELQGLSSKRTKEIKNIFDKAGISVTISSAILVDIWTKFIFIATVSGLGALTRVSIDVMYQHPEVQTLLKKVAQEIYEVSKAKNIGLPKDIISKVMHFIKEQPTGATASTQRDIMSGKPSELQNFNGYVVQEGKNHNIPTPINEFVYLCLQPQEAMARKNQ